MDARLNVFSSPAAGKLMKHLIGAAGVVGASSVPYATLELVNLRCSQINGCGFCTDMHTKDAVAAGETQLRLNLVAAWREAAGRRLRGRPVHLSLLPDPR